MKTATTSHRGNPPVLPLPGYDIHARSHLSRARAQLDAQTPEGIYYAAFELRCGIEARLRQYLLVQEENEGRVKRGWRVAKLAGRLNQHFETGDKYVKVIVEQPGRHPYVLMYTPVTRKLRKMCEKLGGLMHAPEDYHPPADPWWNDTRNWLGEVRAELCKAARGNLLGVPLMNPDDGSVHFATEPAPEERLESHRDAVGAEGQELTMRVHYLDDIPEEPTARGQK